MQQNMMPGNVPYQTSPVQSGENEVKIYKTYKGRPLIVGNPYKVEDSWYIYMGDFVNETLVPNVVCCYTIGDGFYIRSSTPDFNRPIMPQRRRRADDDVKIKAPIKDTDNTLMVLIKTLIDKKNITRGDFKELYTNVSDMNNVLRCIISDENLSWARFTDLCDKLDVQYDMTIRDKNGDEIIKT